MAVKVVRNPRDPRILEDTPSSSVCPWTMDVPPVRPRNRKQEGNRFAKSKPNEIISERRQAEQS